MTFSRLWYALLVAIAVAVACSSQDVPTKAVAEGCVINTDCTSPLVCAFRKCHAECITSRDCAPGLRCVASDRPFHVCQLPEEAKCSHNSDCPERQICSVDLLCRDECTTSRDCVKEQVCAGGACAGTDELVEGGLPNKASKDSDASVGGRCLYTSECEEPLVCRNNTCTSECHAAVDCKGGKSCVNNRCVSGLGTLIGPAGGVVTSSSGKVTLTVPPGAIVNPVAIVILALEAWPSGALGPAFEITPSGLQFAKPATLTYTYAPAEIGAVPPASLQVAVAMGTKWTPLPSMVDIASSHVSAPLEHLSTYGIVSPSALDASVIPDGPVSDGSATMKDAGSDVSTSRDSGGGGASDAAPDAKPVCTGPFAPTLVAGGLNQPQGFVIQGGTAYFSDVVDGVTDRVLAVPLSGLPDGGSPTVIAQNLQFPYYMTADTTGVFFSTQGVPGSVLRAPLGGVPDGGMPTVLSNDANTSFFPDNLVLLGTDIFWSGSGIRSAPVNGSGPTTLHTPADSAEALTTDGSRLYWYRSTSASLLAIDLLGLQQASNPTVIASGFTVNPNGITAIYADPSGVYFAANLGIWFAPYGGVPDGGSPKLLATTVSAVTSRGLTGDYAMLYYSDYSDGSVWKVPMEGGTPVPIACNQQHPTTVLLDGNLVYWANSGSAGRNGDALMSAPK